MKYFRRPLISNSLLIIFLSYTVLNCTYENENPPSILVERIRTRVVEKNFEMETNFHNPFIGNGKANSEMFYYMARNYSRQGEGNFFKQRIADFHQFSSPFRLASTNNTYQSEYETMGIDNPEIYDIALTAFTEYYQGMLAPEVIQQELLNANNLFRNYALTYAGAQQFFLDMEATGRLTGQQSTIIQAELNALLQAKTIAEALSINKMIEQEVLTSQMSIEEQSTILTVNALIENLLISDTTFISTVSNFSNSNFHFAGMASWQTIAGSMLMLAGIVVLVVGSPVLGAGLYGFGFGLFIE